jgi:hypothetical protein
MFRLHHEIRSAGDEGRERVEHWERNSPSLTFTTQTEGCMFHESEYDILVHNCCTSKLFEKMDPLELFQAVVGGFLQTQLELVGITTQLLKNACSLNP